MTRFLGTPLKGEDFSSASSEAFSAKVASDTAARIRIDAGGRITWGDGTSAGDVYVYRYGADILRFVGNVVVDRLFIGSIEVSTTGATLDQVLKYDGTKFVPGTNVASVAELDDVGDVVITSPSKYQTLAYDGTQWVNSESSVATLVSNAETTSLVVGEVVYLYAAQGDRAAVKRASNSAEGTSSKTVGIVAETITPNGTGTVITQGYVSGIDTSAYLPGDVLWLGSTAGTFTKIKPSAPNHLVFVGVVARANAGNGIVFVKTQNGFELDELHNVQASSPSSGDFLKYDGSVWVNDPINLGTDTVGNYVADVTAGTGVTVTHTPGEGSSAAIAIGQSVATSASPTFAGATINGVRVGLNTTPGTGGGATNRIDTTSGWLYLDSYDGTTVVDDNLNIKGIVQVYNAGNVSMTIGGSTITGYSALSLQSSVTPNGYINLMDEVGIYSSKSLVFYNVTTGNKITLAQSTVASDIVVTLPSVSGTLATGQTVSTTSNVTFNNVNVSGTLTVNGTTTTVNSTTVTVDDPIITLGGDTAPSSDDNKDRGVEFRYHNGAAPKVGFFGYDDSTGRFVMIPDAINTSEVFSGSVGDIQAGTFYGALSGNASTATSLQTSRTISLTGDVTGSASFDGTANASITATIAANSVALGTDTTGNYMTDVSAGSGISVSHTPSEGSTATVSLNAGIDDLTDVTVTSATSNDFLKYNGTAWVNDPINLGTDTTGDYVGSLVAGTGVTITNNSGEGATPTIAIGQAVSTTSNVTFNNVTVAGNLSVTGSTFGSATLDVDNYKITLNASVTGAPTLNGEIEVNRGTSPDVRVRWNESLDLWEYTNDGSSYSRIGSALMTVSDTPPSSPYTGDLWFESDSGITFVRYDSHWIEIGASGIGAVTSDTAPSNPANGQIWFESDTNQLKIYYGGSWIQVGGSAAATLVNAINAKGDLLVGTADDTASRLAVGTNGFVLTANSTTSTGLEWVSRASVASDFEVASIMGAY